MPQQQKTPPTPDESARRLLLAGIAPAIVVAVLVIAGAVVFGRSANPESAAGPPDGSALAGSALADSARAGSEQIASRRAGAGPVADGATQADVPTQADVAAAQAEITALMQRHIAAVNDGDAAGVESTLCRQVLEESADLPDGKPLQTGRAQLDGVSEVLVSDGAATAVITASEVGAPENGAKDTALLFVDQDGWKLCPQA